MYVIRASQEVFEIAAIGEYASTTQTWHGLADMFKNTGSFTDRSSRVGYLCLYVHYRVYECIFHKALNDIPEEKKSMGDKLGDLGSQATGLLQLIHLFRNVRFKWSHTNLP